MPKCFAAVLAGLLFCAPAVLAADDCSETLKKLDTNIAGRGEAIAEMKAEISESGGTTDEQKKVLDTLEAKLAEVQAERAALAGKCPTP